MYTSKNADAKQLARRVFEVLKENDLSTFETDFKHAYDVAIAQCRLGTFQTREFFHRVKRLSKALLTEHARKDEKKSRLPDYFRFRQPIPERFILASLC